MQIDPGLPTEGDDDYLPTIAVASCTERRSPAPSLGGLGAQDWYAVTNHHGNQLEREFSEACFAAIEESRRLGYDPTAWVDMIRRYGAAEAARRLLISGDIHTWFQRLVDLKRADLTIEWAALSEGWAPLFRDDHREAARWRLRQAGVDKRG